MGVLHALRQGARFMIALHCVRGDPWPKAQRKALNWLVLMAVQCVYEWRTRYLYRETVMRLGADRQTGSSLPRAVPEPCSGAAACSSKATGVSYDSCSVCTDSSKAAAPAPACADTFDALSVLSLASAPLAQAAAAADVLVKGTSLSVVAGKARDAARGRNASSHAPGVAAAGVARGQPQPQREQPQPQQPQPQPQLPKAAQAPDITSVRATASTSPAARAAGAPCDRARLMLQALARHLPPPVVKPVPYVRAPTIAMFPVRPLCRMLA